MTCRATGGIGLHRSRHNTNQAMQALFWMALAAKGMQKQHRRACWEACGLREQREAKGAEPMAPHPRAERDATKGPSWRRVGVVH